MGFEAGKQQLLFFLEQPCHLLVALGYNIASNTVTMFAEHDIVVLTMTNEFTSLASVAFIDETTFLYVDASSVFSHRKDVRFITFGKAGCKEPGIAFVIPNGCAIVPTSLGKQGCERFPWTFGFGCRGHEKSFVGCAKEEIEASLVISERTCPNASAVAVHLLPSE